LTLSLQGIFKAMAKKDRDSYCMRIAQEAEEGLKHNRMGSVYKSIKTLAGGKRSTSCQTINKSDGSPCQSDDDVLRRWREHFESALNHPPGVLDATLDEESSSAIPDPDTSTDEPTLAEVATAIRKLQNGRAPGPDGIPSELLKCAIGPVSRALHSLFIRVWRTGRVPADWRDGIIVTLYKGKGPKTDCNSYRPITLLSVPGKVFAHVLLARIQPLLVRSRRPQQSGFTASRSTIDAILALRLLSELHREFNRPLHVAYLDIKAAFDSVDRQALWKALRGVGVPDMLIKLIEALHTNTGACVRSGCKLSDRFSTTSGVRQGCILAPALFCVAIDWIMRHMAVKPEIKVGTSTFSDMVYADDAALLPTSPDSAVSCLSSFSQSAAPLGLRVSWPKTKFQNLGSGPRPSNITVDGNVVESVDSFIYLGSLQSATGYCRPDMKRRIAMASSVMSSLSKVWRDRRLQLTTKIFVYRTLVLPVLLYAAETWTILAADVKTIEAFHMKCQRQILRVRWQEHVTNIEITRRTKLPPLLDAIVKRRDSVFGHIARLPAEVPAHQVLQCQVDLSLGRRPDSTWKRHPGRPRNRWLDQLRRNSGAAPANLWRHAQDRGHGGATLRSSMTTRR